jgi:hypothetical protein
MKSKLTMVLLIFSLGLLWTTGAMARGPMSAKAQSAYLESAQEATPEVRTSSGQGTVAKSKRGQQSSKQAIEVPLRSGRAPFRH